MKKTLDIFNKNFRHGNCPSCGKSWDGGDIPEDIREHYSEPYKWSKLISVEDPWRYDGVSWWQCPFCKTSWNRWTGSPEEIIEYDPNEKDVKNDAYANR
jgi:hypothetical protein